MYCPRCGAPNTDTTKFCRQCGLPLAEVTGYVAAGGTGALVQPPPPPIQHPIPPGYELPQLPESSTILALKQKRTLAILACVFLPIIFAIIGNEVFHADELAGIPFILMPLAIIWVSMRYKLKIRRLQEEELQQAMAARHLPLSSLPAAQRPITPPQSIAAPREPAYQPPTIATPTPTNRFTPPSVVEDETRRLP